MPSTTSSLYARTSMANKLKHISLNRSILKWQCYTIYTNTTRDTTYRKPPLPPQKSLICTSRRAYLPYPNPHSPKGNRRKIKKQKLLTRCANTVLCSIESKIIPVLLMSSCLGGDKKRKNLAPLIRISDAQLCLYDCNICLTLDTWPGDGRKEEGDG